MKHVVVFSLFALLLAACAPAAEPVPAAEPIFYRGGQDEIYAAVVQAMSTSPGLPGSNGWIITQSDRAGGFVRAETAVGDSRRESVSVVVSANGDRTQVIIQLTSGGAELAERIRSELDAKFNRA